jgi:hypothetical protein
MAELKTDFIFASFCEAWQAEFKGMPDDRLLDGLRVSDKPLRTAVLTKSVRLE